MPYFEIVVAKAHTSRRLFTYEHDAMLVPGAVVNVPYGRRTTYGVVVQDVKKPTFSTKTIARVLPYVLPTAQVKLLQWMLQYYPEDYGDIAQQFLPTSFTLRSPEPSMPTHPTNTIRPLPSPTTEQREALRLLSNEQTERMLLHGDTGSGKTRVFLEAIQKTIETGKSVLVLTPEIGLTPQLVRDLEAHVAAPTIVTHSALTSAQRRKIWQQVIGATGPIICLGPRSAVFLPIHNIGLIVMDESHDDSYKQLQAPRYRTLDIASQLASISNARLIQSTATPNVYDYYSATQRGYVIHRMTQKAAGDASGHIQCIDTTNRELFGASKYIADQVITATRQAVSQGDQVLFFLNRRGTARSIACQACGWKPECTACHIPLVYHHDTYRLICHVCSRHHSPPSSCPECGSSDILYSGLGTKSLALHLSSLFPEAHIQRFDADTRGSEQLQHHIDSLRGGLVDIIVGTQTITKGLDLPHLSVACAVQADDGLQFPDYRAEELTFQQLYQLIGRTIRGHRNSVAFLQTRQPDHPIFQALVSQNWHAFYEREVQNRKLYRYPPYAYLALCSITTRQERTAEHASQKAAHDLTDRGLMVIGPGPSFYAQSSRGYIWHMVVKSKRRSDLVALRNILDPRWTIDIDPQSLL